MTYRYEEPLSDGWYFVRLFEGANWQPAQRSGFEWFIIGASESFDDVAEVGPRIEAPSPD